MRVMTTMVTIIIIILTIANDDDDHHHHEDGEGEVVEPPHQLDLGVAPSDADIQSLLETEMEFQPSTRHDGSATRNRLVRAVDEAGIHRRAV